MRHKVLIALIIAVVILGAGIALLLLLPESEPEPIPEQPAIAPSGTTADLIDVSYDEMASISFRPREGAQYTLRINPASGEIELDATDVVFPGFRFALQAVFMNATTLRNINMATDDADDEQLTLLGFDDPYMSVTVGRTDGQTIELQIGSEQPVGNGRYARIQSSREVFILDERQALMLTRQLEDLYDISFYPFELFPDEEWVANTIDHILLETGSDVYEIQKRLDEDFEGLPLGSSRFHVLQPFVGEGNDHNVQTLILENVSQILPGSVKEVFPADLSVYGLDAPNRLTLTAGDWSRTLLIGDRDPDGEGRFIMIEGHDAVLLDPNGDYSFLNISPTRLRASLIWLHSIGDVSSIRFDLDGDTRILRLEHNDDDNGLQGWLDDKELSEDNIRRLYVATLMITVNGEADEPMPTDEFPTYTITMYFTDGNSESIELFQLNDSQFLIVHNRESTGFFMTRMTIQQALLSRFEILDAGGDLPAS